MYEKFLILKKMLFDPRFRKDIRALKASKPCYEAFAWELVNELDIKENLINGESLNEIASKKGIKHKIFLETVLDILVGSKNLEYSNKKYKLIFEPTKDISKELSYLETHCPGSTEWTHWLRKKSKKTILTGKPFKQSGFEAKRGIELWEKVMNEGPYSLRQIVIDEISYKLKDNNKILDIGCGDGIAIEEIIKRSECPIKLTGLEVSKNYLKRAKNRIKKLSKILNGIKKENCINTNFIIHDLTKSTNSKKYDALIMSLVANHISNKDHEKFFNNIKKMMNKNAIFITFQFLDKSKFERSPMWTMHNIPSHKGFPKKSEFINTIKKIFPKTQILFDGTIIICKLS
jgi:ubiquinone/menaquinone biosynthesis C-methylase UbiE